MRVLDLQAVLHLERSYGSPVPAEDLDDALQISSEAAELAVLSGQADLHRTAYVTLAQVHLTRPDAAGLGHARKAALAAVGFHSSKRGVLAHLALGTVHLRDRRRPGSEQRARSSFHEALRIAELVPREERPFWLWDAAGQAETGLHLCRVRNAEERATHHYRQARDRTSHPGAIRRAQLFLDILCAGFDAAAVSTIRRAAGAAAGEPGRDPASS